MDNITIVENFELPSKGRIYENKSVKNNFQLRSMTTEDEMKRLSHSEDAYRLLSEVIDSCITTPMGISVYDMHIGDYQYILHRLRVVTYGSDYKVQSICPICQSKDEYSIDLDSLEIQEFNEEDFIKYSSFILPKSQKQVEIKFITPRILDQIEAKKREYNRKSTSSKLDNSLLYTVTALIKSIDGKFYDPIKLEQIVRNLPLADTNAILKHGDKLNSLVGLKAVFQTSCPICGVDYNVPFRLTSEFFGPSLD